MTAPRVVEIRVNRVLPSWNEIYKGGSWRNRSRLAEHWHVTVLLCIAAQIPRKLQVPLKPGVRIFASCEFPPGARRYDPDNLCVKVAIDALNGIFLKNDSAEYVHSVTLGPCIRGPKELTVLRLEEGE